MQTNEYYAKNYSRSSDFCAWKQKNLQYYESSELSLAEIGEETCPPDFDWGPDKKQFHTLHCVISGKGSLMVNDRYFEISEGQIFYLSPDDFAYYKSDSAEPWRYIWIRFLGTKSSVIMNFTNLPYVYIADDVDGYVYHALMNIKNEVMRDGGANMYSLTGLLYSFVGGLVDMFPRKNNSFDGNVLEYLDALIDYIHSNYDRANVINAMSKDRNISRSYIYKLFKQYLDISPSEYLENYRIERACSYLKESDIPINDIACLVGYAEAASFFRMFKKKTGLTPHEYRKNVL